MATTKQRRGWKTLKSTIKYKNPWIRIREDIVIRPDGKRGMYGVLEKSPGVFVIPFDGRNVYLIRQFRYAISKTIHEIPAGVMNGKDVVQNARRELKEETGLTAQHIKILGHYYTSSGHANTRAYACLATGLNTTGLKTSGQEGDESILGIYRIPAHKLWRMIRDGKIECGISLAALLLFFTSKKGLRD